MTREKIASRIETFVRTRFTIAPIDIGFTRTAPLFDLGYVDSVGVVELLAFLGEEFGVDVPDHELLSQNFQTVNGIAGIVHDLRDRAGPGTWRRWMQRLVPGD